MFFSIVVPTYNRAHLITKTLQSLLDQTYPDFEIIVVDDGSTDNTEEVVKKINADKIKYYKIANSERAAARNYGATKATGDYVNFFDSDDIALSNHLAEAQKAVEKYNFPEVFHLSYAVKNVKTGVEKNSIFKYETCNAVLWQGNYLSCNGIFLKREVTLQNPFNEYRKLSASEDWEMSLRIAARFPFYMIPTVTSVIIDHDERSVMTFNESKMLARKNALINSLAADKVFFAKNKDKLPKIDAHMCSYISLHAAITGHKKKAVTYLWKAIQLNIGELFTRRTLGIIKHLILS
ncbi:MAG: glycosyltransferase family 2 protein [Bacteroidia bacterium]|nr:glycosyltransferase family 2 protein [Bacteroidia bacterium]